MSLQSLSPLLSSAQMALISAVVTHSMDDKSDSCQPALEYFFISLFCQISKSALEDQARNWIGYLSRKMQLGDHSQQSTEVSSIKILAHQVFHQAKEKRPDLIIEAARKVDASPFTPLSMKWIKIDLFQFGHHFFGLKKVQDFFGVASYFFLSEITALMVKAFQTNSFSVNGCLWEDKILTNISLFYAVGLAFIYTAQKVIQLQIFSHDLMANPLLICIQKGVSFCFTACMHLAFWGSYQSQKRADECEQISIKNQQDYEIHNLPQAQKVWEDLIQSIYKQITPIPSDSIISDEIWAIENMNSF